MPVTKEQFKNLSEFDTGSWAVWSPKFNKRECIESTPHEIQPYLEARIAELKNDVVLLGLNRAHNTKRASCHPSTGYPKFSNFHAAGHPGDGLLKTIISELPNLQGAYMTDLAQDLDSSSANIRIDSSCATKRLDQQFDILEANQFHIVCFGKKVFAALIEGFKIWKGEFLPDSFGVRQYRIQQPRRLLFCYEVIHYSYAVRFNKKMRLKDQMQSINDLISKSR